MSERGAVTEREVRLGELVDSYQSRRAEDPSIGIGSLRAESGGLFPELTRMAQCLGAIRSCFGDPGAEVPASVGGYTVVSRLGHGVSGVVYAAKLDGDDVALKVMHDSIALSPDALQRFQREIDVAQRLDHPHIVRVLGHGSEGGRLFLAMELVDGASLAELLDELQRHGTVPGDEWNAVLDHWNVADPGGANPTERYARRMAALFAPTASALGHAAKQGLIHRDLKPGNLLLGKNGKLRITDFGLAKVIGEEITATTAVLGTPAFMSPEQASGASKQVDARCDIYGLGATLYRALSHRNPIEAESFGEIVAKVVSTRPRPLSEVNAAMPADLDRIVQRCLEKAPEDRYPDADALARDLERVSEGKPPVVGRVPLARRAQRLVQRRPWELGAVAALLLLAIGVAAWSAFAPVDLEVRVYPGGQVSIDGEVVGTGMGSWSLSKGEHRIRVELDGFVASEETIDLSSDLTLSIHLRPTETFGALTTLADTYGGDAAIPTVARARSVNDEPYIEKLALSEHGAYAARLSTFPEAVRDSAYIRLFAIQKLLSDELYPEAFAAAKALADDHPGEAAPLALALAALDKLELSDRPLYAELFAHWKEVRR